MVIDILVQERMETTNGFPAFWWLGAIIFLKNVSYRLLWLGQSCLEKNFPPPSHKSNLLHFFQILIQFGRRSMFFFGKNISVPGPFRVSEVIFCYSPPGSPVMSLMSMSFDCFWNPNKTDNENVTFVTSTYISLCKI